MDKQLFIGNQYGQLYSPLHQLQPQKGRCCNRLMASSNSKSNHRRQQYLRTKKRQIGAGRQAVSKLQLEIPLVDEQQKTNLVLYEYKDGMQNIVEIKRRADYWCQLINKAVQELQHPTKQSSRHA
jgi:hypothetical protein